uniref:Uncharacterized protein n=1 Tax=Arundo donax TaxID=35708 RepID=A0A0A9B6H3_ARUDO
MTTCSYYSYLLLACCIPLPPTYL